MDGALGHHASPPARARALWPLCHPARQNEGPLGHCASPPARARALWPASWPPALRNGVSRKREHNAHFSPFEETHLATPPETREWTKSGQKEGPLATPTDNQPLATDSRGNGETTSFCHNTLGN